MSTSPRPKKQSKVSVGESFPQAMQDVIDGNAIARLEWADDAVNCRLKDGLLMIWIHNEWHTWTVNDGDMLATDWIVVGEDNSRA